MPRLRRRAFRPPSPHADGPPRRALVRDPRRFATFLALLGLVVGGLSGLTTGVLLRHSTAGARVAGALTWLFHGVPATRYGAAPGPKATATGSGSVAVRPGPGPVPVVPGESVLVMGTDATSNGGRSGLRGNTDTMMVVHVVPADPDPARPGPKLAVMSVPRDTRLHIPGHGTFKVNACNAYEGPKLARQVVADYLDVKIDHYLLVNLHAMIALADAVGGIDVTVPKRMDYDDWSGRLHIHLAPGVHHMDGRDMEAYLRFRHDENADIGRIGRQQMLVKELLAQVLTPRNLLRAPAIWGAVRGNLETDMSLGELLDLARFVHGLDLGKDVRMTMLPGYADTIGGVSYWIGDRDTAAPFLDRWFRGRPAVGAGTASAAVRVATGGRSVTVWDGVGLRSRAISTAEQQVVGAGYHVSHVESVPDQLPHPRTQVIAERGDATGAEELAKALGGGEVVVAAKGDYRTDFTVLLGRDRLPAVR